MFAVIVNGDTPLSIVVSEQQGVIRIHPGTPPLPRGGARVRNCHGERAGGAPSMKVATGTAQL